VKQKKVKIIGLSINQQLGALSACEVEFKEDKNTVIRGEVGAGKTQLQTAIKLCTQGSKTLTDKKLYGVIDTEVQLIDGDLNVWVGCKSDKDGGLNYSLYAKDGDNKKIKEPIIDGEKATPAKYLDALQTELTWRLDELTSENPTTQKKILLKMYQYAFSELGVIFDRNSPAYKGTILHQLDEAKEHRSTRDGIRKQYGGIKEDLIERGFDPDRASGNPDSVDINAIEAKIKEQEKLKTIEETQSTSGKDGKLQTIKTKVAELTIKANAYNQELNIEHDARLLIAGIRNKINMQLQNLELKDATYLSIQQLLDIEAPINEDKPLYIEFDEKGIMVTNTIFEATKANDITSQMTNLRTDYRNASAEKVVIDTKKFNDAIAVLLEEKEKGVEINLIVTAIDSYNEWKNADDEVKSLNRDYAKLLAKVDTGVDGLEIVPEENGEQLDIYLMYNGIYDTKYFNNPENEMRKLSSYSGTQKPVICLLIQNHLLSQKKKAMRYMFIDNIPMDNKTTELLEKMGKDLDLTLFINITGDFDANTLADGDILVEGGNVFFDGKVADKPKAKAKSKKKVVEKEATPPPPESKDLPELDF